MPCDRHITVETADQAVAGAVKVLPCQDEQEEDYWEAVAQNQGDHGTEVLQ